MTTAPLSQKASLADQDLYLGIVDHLVEHALAHPFDYLWASDIAKALGVPVARVRRALDGHGTEVEHYNLTNTYRFSDRNPRRKFRASRCALIEEIKSLRAAEKKETTP